MTCAVSTSALTAPPRFYRPIRSGEMKNELAFTCANLASTGFFPVFEPRIEFSEDIARAGVVDYEWSIGEEVGDKININQLSRGKVSRCSTLCSLDNVYTI